MATGSATPAATASTTPSATASATPSAPASGADTPGLFAVTSSYVMLRLGYGEDAPERRFHHGSGTTAFSQYQAVSGDFDGDGRDTVGVYDLRTATFTLLNLNAAGAPEIVFRYGQPVLPSDDVAGVIAVAGDWDGDGVDTIGLFDLATNEFRLRNENSAGEADLAFVFGSGAVRPVVGDWDGDGVDTIGVFASAMGIAHLRNSNSAGEADLAFDTGRPRLLPVAGDFDGDGVHTVGTYSAEAMQFYLLDGPVPGHQERTVRFGSRAANWAPMAGQWDTRGETGEHEGFDWPTANPADEGVNPQRLTAAYARAAEIQNLHSLLVVRHGKLVGEAYFNGYDASMANCLKSVSKSLLSALYGQAIEDGYLRGLEQPVSAHLPGYYRSPAEPRLARTTIQHLLTMTGGQSWDEDTHIGPMAVSPDWVGHVAGLPFVAEPGARWNYNTGLTHVASALLTAATGMPTHAYAEKRLFEPLGISVTRWDRDTHGRDFGGAEVWMRPRDMARFGELYLRGGEIDGRRIVPAGWVSYSTRSLVQAGNYTYGAWWWRRAFAGHETYFAWGYGGQFIFVVPDLDLVVVTTSAWFRGRSAATNGPVFALLEEHILPAVGRD